MKRLIKQAILGLVAAGSVAAAATPAEARRYDRHYRHHDRGDAALAAGVIGLAAGLALASDGRRYGYYDRPYYRRGYYRSHYRPHYRPYRGGYWGVRCFMRRSWDYWGRPVRVRVCR